MSEEETTTTTVLTEEQQEQVDASLIGRLPAMIKTREFWSGFTLGAQEDRDDTGTSCYAGYDSLYTLIETSNIDFDAYAAMIMNKGKSATDMGYMIQLF